MVGVRATSRASATYVVAPAALAGVLALATAVAWGDVGHAPAPDEGTQIPRIVWLLGIALTILVGLLLLPQARRGGDYLRRVRGFSRNARLLLLRTPFSGLSVSIWRLLFYLYLLASGHDTLFVAQLASINWIAHGLSVIPSGIHVGEFEEAGGTTLLFTGYFVSSSRRPEVAGTATLFSSWLGTSTGHTCPSPKPRPAAKWLICWL